MDSPPEDPQVATPKVANEGEGSLRKPRTEENVPLTETESTPKINREETPTELQEQTRGTKANFYAAKIGEIFLSKKGDKYEIVDFLGQGSFGQVLKVKKLDPPPDDPIHYAIKIIRKSTPFLMHGKREVEFLNWIKQYGGVNGANFIVRFIEEFMHGSHLCLLFELLSTSLLDLVNLSIEANPEQPGLSLRMVHKFSHQLVTVLYTLAKIKIIHSDIKPENIALTSPNMAHIKVLDFGSACHASETGCNLFPYIQSRFYRSPEVLLGCNYSYPIDMWSLGCVLVELYTARPLFAGSDRIDQLYVITNILGWPSRAFLDQAMHYKLFFKHQDGKTVPKKEFNWNHWRKDQIPLWDRINVKNEQTTDLHNFYDLISQMLIFDPEKRITPEEALNHPFIVNGPATRNRQQSQPTLAPSEQTIPIFALPPWGYPGTTGSPILRTSDPSVAHERAQKTLREEHFSSLTKRNVVKLPERVSRVLKTQTSQNETQNSNENSSSPSQSKHKTNEIPPYKPKQPQTHSNSQSPQSNHPRKKTPNSSVNAPVLVDMNSKKKESPRLNEEEKEETNQIPTITVTLATSKDN